MSPAKSAPTSDIPAEVLAELLHEHGMTQRDLSRFWNLSPAYISDLCGGRRTFSARVALRLEATFDVPATLWMNLERDRELRRKRLLMASELNRLRESPLA